MSWVEDTVSFRGVIRRSGNSLVATIPPELSQRFMIREGQEYTIVGMTRSNSEFEGALQIYLGFFVVLEKAPRLDLVVEGIDFDALEQVLKRYGASTVVKKEFDDGRLSCYAVFSAVEKNRVRPARSVESIQESLSLILRDVKELGGVVKSAEVSEVVLESRQVDPAVLAKSPSRLEKNLAWKWEL